MCSSSDDISLKKKRGKYPNLVGFSDIEPDLFSLFHYQFMGNVFQVHEPVSYKHACNDKNWIEVVNKEIKALEDNGTRVVTD